MIAAAMVSALRDLARLRAADGAGLYGSGGELFSDAIFGRDSATCAEALLHLRHDLARDVIRSLARLQGRVEAPVGPHSNEEEPGKIHHEHRTLFIGSRRISPTSESLLHMLASMWGGNETSLTYYGSVDATPLYARLVAHYCAEYGDAILAEDFVARDGARLTIRDSLLAAVDWITGRMDASPVGFVEFLHRNPAGIPFQVWKDSGTSYLHADGTIADWDAPIAAVEVQGYAYDALLSAALLFPTRAEDWRERAERLRSAVLEHLWMPGEEYFAMGVERGADGRQRWIESVASNAALLLDTSLFDGLDGAERYIGGVVRCICGPEFVTEVGVRCRAVSEDGLVDFQDYHGAWTVWMKETYDVVRGLERQGLAALARQLGNRLLNAVNVAGANVEFLYVSPDQRVMYDFGERDLRAAEPEPIAGTNRPEAPQTWTASAALALKWRLSPSRELLPQGGAAAAQPWRRELEAETLAGMPRASALSSAEELRNAYARRGDFVLDLAAGQARDGSARERRRRSGGIVR